MKKILLTRPLKQSIETKNQFSKLGLDCDIAPLIEIGINNQNLDVNKEDLIIITSANGVEALARNSDYRDYELLTIGNASKDKSLELGFENVTSITSQNGYISNEENLVEYIAKNILYSRNLVHITSDQTSGKLSRLLTDTGYNLQTINLYKSSYLNFDEGIIDNIRNQKYRAITLFSSKTARQFLKQIEENNLHNFLAKTYCFCLSDNCVKEVEELNFIEISSTKNNDIEELISDVKRVLSN